MYLCEPNELFAFKCDNKCIHSRPTMNAKTDINSNNKKPTGMVDSGEPVRNEEVLALRNKFPTKIPTIIRSRLQMGPNQALYLLVNNRSMLSLSLTLAEAYGEFAGADGFLYITYASQEVFGWLPT